MATEKDHAKKASASNEPSFNSLASIDKVQLIWALNWYNLEDANFKRKKILSWAKKNAKDLVPAVNKAKDSEFGTMASLLCVRIQGAILSDQHETELKDWLGGLGQTRVVKSNVEPAPAPAKPKVARRAPIDTNFENFDDAMERAYHGRPSKFEIDVKKPTDKIVAVCRRELENIKAEPGSYPKQMKAFFQSVLERLGKVATATVGKVTAAPKKVPVGTLVKDLRGSKECPEYGLKGKVNFSNLMGAKKLYVFDPKYRSLIRFVSTEAGFSANGINLTNVDLTKSGYVTIRKPTVAMKADMGIRELDSLFNSLKVGKVESVRTQERYLFLNWS